MLCNKTDDNLIGEADGIFSEPIVPEVTDIVEPLAPSISVCPTPTHSIAGTVAAIDNGESLLSHDSSHPY